MDVGAGGAFAQGGDDFFKERSGGDALNAQSGRRVAVGGLEARGGEQPSGELVQEAACSSMRETSSRCAGDRRPISARPLAAARMAVSGVL